MDFGSDESVALALLAFRTAHGPRIASVVHLAAHFDLTGEDNPLYQSVNVDRNRRPLRTLQGFEVGQFLYQLAHIPAWIGLLV
jgi:hypothetical protein